MPWIRRATATAITEDGTADEIVAVALTNNDGEERRVYGAALSLFAGNDTLSAQVGHQAIWSTQAIADAVTQQGFDFRRAGLRRRSADDARAGPFAVVQTSGRDNKEDSNEVMVEFGHPDNWIPWPDGAQMHLGVFSLADNDNGARAHGILYYQEGAGGL